jgi:tRNA A37 threonylcarbamoyladenosine modification protein TsaB
VELVGHDGGGGIWLHEFQGEAQVLHGGGGPVLQYDARGVDARRGQVYCGVYKNGTLIRQQDVCPLEEVLELVKDKKCVFTGDGVKAFKEKIQAYMGDNALFTLPQHNYTRAASALYLAQKAFEDNELVSAAALDAIYLRKPQAEREYENRNS